MKPKIIVIVGQTATGKTASSILVAKKFNGEIISADSRQVYKGLDLGAGKVTKKEMSGVPHHLLDVANPKKVFSVSDFKSLAEKKIAAIAGRGKLPIICGGTGFYIQAITDGDILPDVPPDKELRKRLEAFSTEKLFAMLKKNDPKRALTIDPHNKVRLVRAIEIAKKLGSVPALKKADKFDVLIIGLKLPDKKLKDKINKRLIERISMGMINEARRLHAQGLSWKRMEALGLEYRYEALYLQKKITKKEMIERLSAEIWKYAKRQNTWFKKDKRIHWFDPSKKSTIRKIDQLIKEFLKKK